MELEKTYPIMEGYYIEINHVPRKPNLIEDRSFFNKIIVNVSEKGDPHYLLAESVNGSIHAGVSFWHEYFTRDTIKKIKRVCKLRISHYNSLHNIEFIPKRINL